MGRGGHVNDLRQPDRRGIKRGPSRWTDEQLEAELRAFTAGREAWPKGYEFIAAGRGDLVHAVSSYGGVPYWATRLGLELRPGQDRRPRSNAELVAEARALIAEHGRLPGIEPLIRNRHRQLVRLIRASGGRRAFMRQHGLDRIDGCEQGKS